MSITAHYDNGTKTLYATRQVPVTKNIACSVSFKDSDWQYTQVPNTNRYVGGKLVMQNIGDPNNPQLRVVAYSKLVQENPDGSYSGFKGEMYVELECAVKNPDNCTTRDNLVGSGWDSKAKTQTLHRTASNNLGSADPAWSVSRSKHGYKLDGTWYWKEIFLYPCN